MSDCIANQISKIDKYYLHYINTYLPNKQKELQEKGREYGLNFIRVHNSCRYFLETYGKIKTKERGIQPFILNQIQRHYDYNKTNRDIILKPRQVGFTTYNLGRFLFNTIFNDGVNTLIISEDEDDIEKFLFTIKLMFNSIPFAFRPRVSYDNKKELIFSDIGSSIAIKKLKETVGRSQTIHNLLCTELAFWTKDVKTIMTGLLNSVPENGNIVFESTPNGVGNYYHAKFIESLNPETRTFTPFFYEWWWDVNYTKSCTEEQINDMDLKFDEEELFLIKEKGLSINQILWRRFQQKDLGDKFKQEYAESIEGCFLQSGQKIFTAGYVNFCHCEPKEPIPGHNYLVAGDPAEGLPTSHDSACIVFDCDTSEQVAAFKGKYEPEVFANMLVTISKKYNDAFLVYELNNHGHAVALAVKNLGYKNIYWTDKDRGKSGFVTGVNKPYMIDLLEEALRNNLIKLSSLDLRTQLIAYTGEKDPMFGDDLVMAMAIGYYVHRTGRIPRKPGKIRIGSGDGGLLKGMDSQYKGY